MSERKPSVWQALLTRKMLICVVTGFSSGLPLFLLFNLLPAWLKTEGLSLQAIGAFALVQFPYTWKFLWSPLVDRFGVPGLGRRRGWMFVSQCALIVGVLALGTLSPTADLIPVIAVSVLIAFLSASQDIAIDAYRRELLAEEELGLGNAVFVNAYKLAALVPGSLALILADHLPWFHVFAVTAGFLIPGAILSLLIAEPQRAPGAPRTLHQAVVEPFHEFFTRQGVATALWILAFMLFFKLGEAMATTLATPFYLELGFSKTEIGLVAKNAGLWAGIVGGLAGGIWMVKLGINRALWVFGVAQTLTILGFAWLAHLGTAPTDTWRLVQLGAVYATESFCSVGLGTTAFTAFMARTTNPAFAATQFALFSSLMAVPRTVVNAFAGVWVVKLGWFDYFWLCFALAIPGILMLVRVAPWREETALARA